MKLIQLYEGIIKLSDDIRNQISEIANIFSDHSSKFLYSMSSDKSKSSNIYVKSIVDNGREIPIVLRYIPQAEYKNSGQYHINNDEIHIHFNMDMKNYDRFSMYSFFKKVLFHEVAHAFDISLVVSSITSATKAPIDIIDNRHNWKYLSIEHSAEITQAIEVHTDEIVEYLLAVKQFPNQEPYGFIDGTLFTKVVSQVIHTIILGNKKHKKYYIELYKKFLSGFYKVLKYKLDKNNIPFGFYKSKADIYPEYLSISSVDKFAFIGKDKYTNPAGVDAIATLINKFKLKPEEYIQGNFQRFIDSIYNQFKLITDDDFIKKSIPSINDMINVVFEYFNKNYEKLRNREYRGHIIDIIEKFNFSKSVNKLHNLLTYTR